MRVVAFYCFSEQQKHRLKQAAVIAAAAGFAYLIFVFLPVQAQASQPAGKGFGEWLGKWDKQTREAESIYRRGTWSDEYLKQYIMPSFDAAKTAIQTAYNQELLTDLEFQQGIQKMYQMLGRVPGKVSYENPLHEALALLKGGLLSGKMDWKDATNLANYFTNPDTFPAELWSKPGTALYVPPGEKLSLFKRIGMKLFGQWFRNVSPLPGVNDTPMQLPGAADGQAGLLPGAYDGQSVIAPGAEQGGAELPAVNKGFAYLHSMPDSARLVRLDDFSLPPEQQKLMWIITIGGIIARAAAGALGVPLP